MRVNMAAGLGVTSVTPQARGGTPAGPPFPEGPPPSAPRPGRKEDNGRIPPRRGMLQVDHAAAAPVRGSGRRP